MGWARPAAPGRAARRGAGGRRATARRSAGGARRRGPPACGRCRGRLAPRRPARPRCVPSPGPRRPGLGTGCGGGRAEPGGAAAPRAGAEPGERLTEEQAVVLRVGMAALLRAVQGHDATRGAGGGGPHAPPSADAQQRQQRAHGGGRTARLGRRAGGRAGLSPARPHDGAPFRSEPALPPGGGGLRSPGTASLHLRPGSSPPCTHSFTRCPCLRSYFHDMGVILVAWL